MKLNPATGPTITNCISKGHAYNSLRNLPHFGNSVP